MKIKRQSIGINLWKPRYQWGILWEYDNTVECVCLLSKRSEARNHIDVKVDMNEIDVTSAEKKTTCQQIKE